MKRRRHHRSLRRRYGRAVSPKKLLERFEVHRIHINVQGYDRHGHYYGSGAPLFRVYDNDTGKDHVTRAADAREARAKAVGHWMKHENYSGSYGRKVWSPFAETVEETYHTPRY